MLKLGIRLIGTVAIVLLAGTASAQNSFEELTGKFVIDLPDGYKLKPQKFPILFQFSHTPGQIMMLFEEGNADLAASYDSALSNLDGTVKNPAPVAPIATMTLNGSPAKWGVYKGMAESDGVAVPIYTYVGSILVDDGSIFFVTFLSVENQPKWGEKITKSFFSLRNVDSPLTGPQDIKMDD